MYILTAEITGNVADQAMVNAAGDANGAFGLLSDVQIDLGTATSVVVQIEDERGIIFGPTGAVVADTAYKEADVLIIRRAVTGKLLVTTTSISNAAHTVTVRAWVDA